MREAYISFQSCLCAAHIYLRDGEEALRRISFVRLGNRQSSGLHSPAADRCPADAATRRSNYAKLVIGRLERSRANLPRTSPDIGLSCLECSALVELGLDRAVSTGRVAAQATDMVGMVNVAQACAQHALGERAQCC